MPAEEDTNGVSAASGTSPGEESLEDVDFGNGRYGPLVEHGMQIRDEVLRTLTIHDWSLFGEDEEARIDGMQE